MQLPVAFSSSSSEFGAAVAFSYPQFEVEAAAVAFSSSQFEVEAAAVAFSSSQFEVEAAFSSSELGASVAENGRRMWE